MSTTLLSCGGGRLTRPDSGGALVDREDGGHLVVDPPRPVWERSELTRDELMLFSFLVAAAGRAMLDALPQLDGGCVNYWDAGNWALNDAAEPPGPKTARDFRRLHLHLLGRSRFAKDPAWRWGESPRFPDFAARHETMARYAVLTEQECAAVAQASAALLADRYGVPARLGD